MRWAGGGELALEVKAPLAVATNLLSQRASGAFLVHFVNYDVEKDAQGRKHRGVAPSTYAERSEADFGILS